MVFPDYQRVDDPKINDFFEKFWETKLDKKPGLTVVEIMDQVISKNLTGLYVMGENPYSFPYKIWPTQFSPDNSIIKNLLTFFFITKEIIIFLNLGLFFLPHQKVF